MEIRKSDRGLLAEIEAWLSLNRTPEAKDLADLKASILHHLQSTEGETSSWATQSRQLTTEAVNLSNRLLATKFVADEAVGLVGELGRLMEVVDYNTDFETLGVYAKYVENARATLAKAAQFTAAITEATPTVGGEADPVIFPPVDGLGAIQRQYNARPLTIEKHPGLSFAYRLLPTAPEVMYEVTEVESGVSRTDSSLSTAIAKMESLPKTAFQK